MQLFNLDGEFITIWNDIQRPMDISVDGEGVLYVSEGSVNDSSARGQRPGRLRKRTVPLRLPRPRPR